MDIVLISLPLQKDLNLQEKEIISKKSKRTLIAVEVPTTVKGPREFLAMLYPSWVYVSKKYTRNSLIRPDLYIGCESKACPYMPPDCFQYKRDVYNKIISQRDSPVCFWSKLPQSFIKKWKDLDYLFMTSIDFLNLDPFPDISQDYDYILRSDVDAMITPGILKFMPPYGSWFSHGWTGRNYTRDKLESIAKKLNLKHQKAHDMQSSWYVESKYIMPLVKLTSELAEHFLKNEFTSEICIELEKPSNCFEPEGGSAWPDWHRGICSLYVSNLAINHIIPNFSSDHHQTTKIDVEVTKPKIAAGDIIHTHNIHTKFDEEAWHKFPFHSHFAETFDSVCKIAKKEYGWIRKIREKPINDYCRDISWSAVRYFCGLTIDNFDPIRSSKKYDNNNNNKMKRIMKKTS